MSAVVDAYAGRKKAEAMQGTWGHLFPKGTSYKGLVRVAFTDYSEQCILEEEVPFDGSPWWLNAITNWLLELEDQNPGEIWEYNIDIEITPGEDDDGEVITDLYDAEWVITATESRKVLEAMK